ncbi:unnamed protein product [Diatraea saccharalis]|uniref:FP protein C-terminal domain-containing protein n=1 Tax=Diatraea saccharalis TaxID=40085 RepID=A0A9N9R5Y2_9NEOP|nr:unnamed protein product [Diatraea saccharalis]
MPQCAACGKFLSPAGATGCGSCLLKFHKACLGIPEKSQIGKNWVCLACKRNLRKGDNSETPVKGLCDERTAEAPSHGGVTLDAPPGVVVETDPESEVAACTPSDVKGLLEFRQLFAECMSEMREFRKELMSLHSSFKAVTERQDLMDSRLDGMALKLEELEGRLAAGAPSRVVELERVVSELRGELNMRDQDALLADLDVGSVPEEKGENVTHTVTALALRLGITLEERDVVFAERVGAPPAAGGRARRIVVRLSRRGLRDEVLRAARTRRNLEASNGTRIYINERLTRHNRQLFLRVREGCRQRNWRYCWTRHGCIFARQSDGQRVLRFRSDADLERIFNIPQRGSPEPKLPDGHDGQSLPAYSGAGAEV